MRPGRVCTGVAAIAVLIVWTALPGLSWAQDEPADAPLPAVEPPAMMADQPEGTRLPTRGTYIGVSGYLKPVAIWERKDFGDLGPDPRENFEHVGPRVKLRLDGRLQDRARLYTNHILDYNEVDQKQRTADGDGNKGSLRLVEAYVDVFFESSQIRAGAQQKNYLYQFNGLEDITHRFAPSDGAYLGYDLEDGRIPETGLEWSWFYARSQTLSFTYVPVSGINKFSPTLEGFYNFLGYEETSPESASSSNSKYMFEADGRLGGLTYLFSYIDGLNPRPDFAADGFAVDAEDNIDRAQNGRLEYNRYRTPGLDLAYAFTEATIAKLDVVYYETPDSEDNDDPLQQNDWYEYMVGVEMRFDAVQYDLNLGQKIVPGAANTDDADLDDPVGRRVYFQNSLLNQPRERTDVLTFKVQGRAGQAEWLGYKFDVLANWNESGDTVRLRLRPEVAVYLAPDDMLLLRFRPEVDQSREITTQRVWAELEQRF